MLKPCALYYYKEGRDVRKELRNMLWILDHREYVKQRTLQMRREFNLGTAECIS